MIGGARAKSGWAHQLVSLSSIPFSASMHTLTSLSYSSAQQAARRRTDCSYQRSELISFRGLHPSPRHRPIPSRVPFVFVFPSAFPENRLRATQSPWAVIFLSLVLLLKDPVNSPHPSLAEKLTFSLMEI